MCCCWKDEEKEEEEILNHISNIERLSDFKQSSFFFGVDAKNTLYIKKYPSKEETSSVILVVFLLTLCFNYCFIFAENKREEKEEKIFFCVCWSVDQRREFIVPFLCEKIKDIRKVGKKKDFHLFWV